MMRIAIAAMAALFVPLSALAGGRVPLAGLHIPARFESTQLTRENFASAVHACLPTYSDSVIEHETRDWSLPLKNTTKTLRDKASAGAFVITEATGACVHETETGHPIFAIEAFAGTVEPAGVPAALREEWFAEIARLIASKGSAEVVYRFPNGNAQVAMYRPLSKGFTKIEYRSTFKRAGDYDPSNYDAVFAHPDLRKVISIRYGGEFVKPILRHRFLPMARGGTEI